MIKTLALAGATAALVIGSIAVAQTAAPNTDANGNPPATTDQNANGDMNANGNVNANANDATAPSAAQNGANTAATAGERG